ncbi:hypothetical protein GmHk_20G056886 [Glycine max]|nr:hypothetical protein GmHk_20G056886 [Glycine max]
MGCTITCILWGPFAMQLKAWTSVKTTLNLWLSYYTWPKSKNLKLAHNVKVKSLSELDDIKKQCNRLTVATTKKLLVYNGWSFKGCPRCNRKLKRQWSHTHVQAVRIGMREKCLDSDWRSQLHTSNILLQATQLINQSAADLKKQLIQNEGKFDPKSMPKALDNVLKKQLAFKIKIVPNSSCYSVLETSQD